MGDIGKYKHTFYCSAFCPVGGARSVGRGACCTVRSGVSHHWIYLWPQRAIPQALTLLGGVRFIAWRLWCPEKRNADGARGIFGTAGCLWAQARWPDAPKNGLVPYSYARGAYDKYSILFTAKLSRLNPTSRGRIRLTSKAESYILWSHSPYLRGWIPHLVVAFAFHHPDMPKGPFKDH